MSATLELKYFNSFWLKKMTSVVGVSPSETENDNSVAVEALSGSTAITLDHEQDNIGVGQIIYYTISGNNYSSIIRAYTVGSAVITLQEPLAVTLPVSTGITFGEITDFKYVPQAYEEFDTDWYIEEARIRGGYNNTSVDFGVKAYLVEDNNTQQSRPSSLIYSGVFNSRTGVNNTNQFSVGEDISRSVNPAQGSIQKLYAEDTNLIIFQELKVSRALIDKDAIYSAEGQPITTSGQQVIGQIQAYAGEYGISTNPESFAVYGYRKYFTDRNKNAVLRLSQDGITEISEYGMRDFFRDTFSEVGSTGKLIGGWDMHNKQYVLSIQPAQTSNYYTLGFDEEANGWTSFFSYKPDFISSLINNYYSFKDGKIWIHYSTSVNRGNFYNQNNNSQVTVILNANPSLVKNFNTINYEGDNGWRLDGIQTNTDTSAAVEPSVGFSSINALTNLEGQLFLNNFKIKENKYSANIFNITPPSGGEVISGQSMSGIKGFYAICSFSLNNQQYTTRTELFAVSSNYVESSY
jgi:hypothetical protein